MLEQPMLEKLSAMRLNGMLTALQTQEQDPATRELGFLERLALLVDHQWNWRQSQALSRRLTAAKLRGNACVEEIDYRAARGLDKSVIRALAQQSVWCEITTIFSFLGRLVWAKVLLLARWLRKLAAMVTRPSMWVLRRCFVISRSLAPTAVCAYCWPASAASMYWSSMTGRWRP
jgi:hypothetical protein